MMRTAISRKLDNVVECDEMYVAGSIANKHNSVRKKYRETGQQWQFNKTIVLEMIERGGEAMARVVNDAPYVEILNTIHDNISSTAKVMTDTHGYYATLSGTFEHNTVNHASSEYKRGMCTQIAQKVCLVTLRGWFTVSTTKSAKKNTQRYLDDL